MVRKIVVTIPFDNNAAMFYRDEPERRARTIESPMWWVSRMNLFKKYTMRSLLNQTFKSFDVWGFFRPQTKDLAMDMIKLFHENNWYTTYAKEVGFRTYYHNLGVDWLIMVNLDSDDMYSPDAMDKLNRAKLSDGLLMYFKSGYLYDVRTGRMTEFGDEKAGPPPFFAQVYTRKSLFGENEWNTYRKRWKFAGVHHQFGACPNVHAISGRHFIQTVSGNNVTTSWVNPHTSKRCGKDIEGQDKMDVLERFGI